MRNRAKGIRDLVGSAPEYNLANGGPRQENDQKPGHRLKGGAQMTARKQNHRRVDDSGVLRDAWCTWCDRAQAGVLKGQPKAKFISHLSQRDNVDYCIPFWQAMLAAEVQLRRSGAQLLSLVGDRARSASWNSDEPHRALHRDQDGTEGYSAR